jgi:hypothetical protein
MKADYAKEPNRFTRVSYWFLNTLPVTSYYSKTCVKSAAKENYLLGTRDAHFR